MIINFSLFLFVSGCSAQGLSEFKDLCRAGSGEEIKQVVYVDGYFDGSKKDCATCGSDLLRTEFKYIEINNVIINGYSGLNEQGYYKVYKSNAGDKNCNSWMSKRYSDKKLYQEYFSSRCIATKKVDSLESKYGVYSESGYVDSRDLDGSTIIRYNVFVKDLTLDQLIASQVGFILSFPKNLMDYSKRMDCYDAGVGGKLTPLQEKVLKATKK